MVWIPFHSKNSSKQQIYLKSSTTKNSKLNGGSSYVSMLSYMITYLHTSRSYLVDNVSKKKNIELINFV